MSDHDPRVASILRPASVAIIGASRDPRNLGRQVLDNLLAGGFTGRVHPVNPNVDELAGLRCHRSVLDIATPIDLAVIAVPAALVPDVVDECAAAGIRSVVIISAGFREAGPEGAALETKLAAALRAHGMRAVGPNCMGVLNAHPSVRMNATFAPEMPPSGNVAFVSQSGALGLAVLGMAKGLGLGVSYFASLGNKTDVSTNDLLVEWAEDPDVGVILLYLENFGNPRRFVQLARAITRMKPIVAIKSGRTAAGQRAARSHTGALAEADRAAEALFLQSGVVRAATVNELFDFARAFAHAPLPAGRRVAIVTNSGGPGILAADALQEYRLDLAPVEPNPWDLIAGAGPEKYAAALDKVLADPDVDSVLAIYTPPIRGDEEKVVEVIRARKHATKPLLACVLGREAGSEAFDALNSARVPAYPFPESAVRALAALTRHAERLHRPRSEPPRFPEAREQEARRLVRGAAARGEEWLPQEDALRLLALYGIPVAPMARVRTAREAVDAARGMGGSVAVKAIAPTLVHKSEAGAIALDVAGDDAVAKAFDKVTGNARAHGHAPDGALVQAMLPKGREVILGMSADPKFGALMMAGLGGVYVEVLKDVSFRLAPLATEDAREMLRSLRAWPLLQGVRGEAPADVPAIEDALLRLSALVTQLPELAEIDVNPFIVQAEKGGGVAADARVRLWPRGEAPRAAAVPSDLRP